MKNIIETRIDLPSLVLEKNPIGVELGVARGIFSKKIINKYNFKTFYMIHRWRSIKSISRYLKLIKYSNQITKTEVITLRGMFNEFVSSFSDNFFDFIYIDGCAHTGQKKGQTIRDWLPKIKDNGVICGHDYCEEYPKTKHYVDLIGEENNFNINVIGNTDGHASWYYTKK